MKKHWTDLEPKLTIFLGDTKVIRGLGAFCDVLSRDDITAFFATHPLPAAARTLSQTIERINSCIQLKERETTAVTEWVGINSR
jgi:aminopeptidase N/puromycin-sensitive aminopeptidase